MSQSSTQSFTCPRCGTSTEVTVWSNIDASENPELKEQLVSGKLMSFTCPSCQYMAPVQYDMFYQDPGKRLMVWLTATPDKAELDRKTAESKQNGDGVYRRRIVADPNMLLEKIFINDADLDDRVIELLKSVVLSQSQAEEESQEPRQEMLLFSDVHQDDAGQKELAFLHLTPGTEPDYIVVDWKNGYEMTADVLYNKLHIPEQDDEWQVVDSSYWQRLSATGDMDAEADEV